MANFYIEHSRRGLCRTVIVFLFTLFIINLSFADKISLSMKDFQDVYLGMTYEELKEKRPAIVGYSSVMDPKNVFREKKLDNDILKSAFYVFDGQSKLKWVAFGRDFFKPLQAQDGDVSKNAGKYVEYCINTWGKKYRKCVWDFVFNSKEYYIPCLIWEKEDKIIFAYFSFYEKKHDHIPPNYYRIYVARKDTRQGEVVPKNIISDPKIVDGVFLKYLPFINNKNEYYEVKPQKMEIIGKQPKIQIDNSVIDFGKIAEGVQIEQYFIIKNIGDAELNILDMVEECTCTLGVLKKSKLSPGEETKVTVKINAKGLKGKQTKEILIISNDPNESSKKVLLKGEIE